MLKPRSLVVLDIGATKVACAVGRSSPLGNGIDLTHLGTAEHAASPSAWPCEPSLLARTIECALQDAGVREAVDRAWVVLNHPECAHHRVTVDLDLAEEPVMVRERDLARLKAQAVSHSLPLDRDLLACSAIGYTGSGFDAVRQPHGLPTARLRGAFHLISLPLAVKRALIEAVQAVGLEPERFIYSVDAVAAACLDEGMRRQRCLVVDIGAFSTQVGLLAHGTLEQAWTIPWGGMTLALELARSGTLTMPQAVAQSLEGLSSANTAVRDMFQRQLQPVREGLQTAASSGPRPEAVIVSGRGALIDGVVEWVGQSVELKAVLGRSMRLRDRGELSRQVALTGAVGALSAPAWLAARPGPWRAGGAGAAVPVNFVERVIDRTRRILIDYF